MFNTAVDLAREEGIEKGIEQGIERGRDEEKSRLIKAMSSNDIAPSEIATICGLTLEEVANIIND